MKVVGEETKGDLYRKGFPCHSDTGIFALVLKFITARFGNILQSVILFSRASCCPERSLMSPVQCPHVNQAYLRGVTCAAGNGISLGTNLFIRVTHCASFCLGGLVTWHSAIRLSPCCTKSQTSAVQMTIACLSKQANNRTYMRAQLHSKTFQEPATFYSVANTIRGH